MEFAARPAGKPLYVNEKLKRWTAAASRVAKVLLIDVSVAKFVLERERETSEGLNIEAPLLMDDNTNKAPDKY